MSADWTMPVLGGLLLLITLVIMGYGLRARRLPGTSLVRRRLWCSSMEQEADVEFLAGEGLPYAVNRCSVLGKFEREIACGERCLETVRQAAQGREEKTGS